MIEHNLDVIKTADWLVDLGPEGGDGGGRILVTGTPETVAQAATSHTGRFLAPSSNAAEPAVVLALCATARLAEACASGFRPTRAPPGRPRPPSPWAPGWVACWKMRSCGAPAPGQAPRRRLRAALVGAGHCRRPARRRAPLFDLAGLAAAAQGPPSALPGIWTRPPRPWATKPASSSPGGGNSPAAQRPGLDRTARLPGIVCGLIRSGAIALPEAIAFTGFDRYTPGNPPASRPRRPGRGRDERPPIGARRRQTLACNDADAGVRRRRGLGQDRLAAHPGARLGIVVPDLATRRDALAFALDDLLHPEAVYPGAEATRIWLSSAAPGPGTPGRRRLRSARPGCRASPRMGRVLRPVALALLVGRAERADARARIDAALRDELEFFTDLPAVIAAVKRLYGCKRVAAPRRPPPRRLCRRRCRRRSPPPRPLGLGRGFRRWLAALDWPGDRSLSSAEFQARQAFLAALDGLGRYDELLPPSPPAGRRRLAEICAERVFQPETRGNPAIEILGSGKHQTRLRRSLGHGHERRRLAAAARPNPLLPAEIQRRAGTPNASAEVELAFAQTVHRRLLTAAPAITFSWRRRAAPLPAAQPSDRRPARRAGSNAAAARSLPPPRKRSSIPAAPQVPPGEKVSGGTGLLKAQAICPAWGFYQYRLGAQALREPVEGLDPMARGVLVHGALEHFWGATGSSRRAARPERRSPRDRHRGGRRIRPRRLRGRRAAAACRRASAASKGAGWNACSPSG